MGLEEEEGSGSQKGRPARVPEMSVTEMTVGRLLHASVLIGDGNGSTWIGGIEGVNMKGNEREMKKNQRDCVY